MSKGRLYQERKLAGLCTQCGDPAVPGTIRCRQCTDKAHEHYQTMAVKRRAAGLCVICRNPTVGNAHRCDECTERDRVRLQARKDAGLCRKCDEPHLPGLIFCEKHNLEVRQKMIERHRVNRQLILAHYGARCTCCGETIPQFLQLDHINNDGYIERKELGSSSGSGFYRLVVKNNFPDHLQILCVNCNFGKEQNGGVCPHEEIRRQLAQNEMEDKVAYGEVTLQLDNCALFDGM